jgi:Flp pilus assembly protein TadD
VGVTDAAFDHYSDALRLEPRSVAALDGRARLWRDTGLLGPALADAHRARYFAPKSAEVRNTLGTILDRRGLCHEALAEYREALRLKPDAVWAQENVERLGECPQPRRHEGTKAR